MFSTNSSVKAKYKPAAEPLDISCFSSGDSPNYSYFIIVVN